MMSLAVLTFVVVAFSCVTDAVDVGRAHSRHRREISAKGITAEEELAVIEKHKTNFEKFKSAVIGKIVCANMKKDIYLAKFFRANGNDVDKSTAAVLDVIHWRKENKINTIADQDLSKGRNQFEAHTALQDTQGRVILYMQAGKWALKTAIEKNDEKLYEDTFNQLFEEAVTKTIKNYEAGNKNAQYTMLVNYDKWTTLDGACAPCVTVVSRLGVNYQTKWPEFGHKVILYNTAEDFNLFFNVIRLVLSKETNEKISIFGRSRKEWEPEVIKLVDKSQIDKAMNLNTKFLN